MNLLKHQPEDTSIPCIPCDDLFGVCPYVTSQKLLTGKWTLLILHLLTQNDMRWGELQKALPGLTQTTLTKQLRMMEDNGLINRCTYNQIPPKVVYSLTELGRRFSPVLEALKDWGQWYIEFLKDSKG